MPPPEESLTSREARLLGQVKRGLQGWWPGNRRPFPWRELDDEYLRLMAEVLLQRTRAESVAKVWSEFATTYSSPAALASSSDAKLRALIASLGLGNKRTANLRALAATLDELGAIPDSRAELVALPGVGPYTAQVWLATCRHDRGWVVDSNIRRVLTRVLAGEEEVPMRKLRRYVTRLLEKGDPTTVVFGLVDLGSSPCKPRSPDCPSCPMTRFCTWAKTHRQVGARAS